MTPELEALRACAKDAAEAARSAVDEPSLHSVLVDLGNGPAGPVPVAYQFGFQQLLSGRFLGERLKTCFVEARLHPRSVHVISTGTYGTEQFRALASIPGHDFPPPAFEIEDVGVAPRQVLDLVRAKPLAGAPGLGTVRLSLCHHEGTLVWRVLQEVPGVAFRTLFVDAADARILLEKVDAANEGGG